MMAPLHELLDRRSRTFEERLDAAVRQVPHPTRHTKTVSFAARRFPEEDPLHPAPDEHADAHA